LSNSILYSGEVIDKNDIKLFFNKPGKLNHNINIQANHQIIHAGFADTGSPHVVIRIENLLKDPNDPQSFFHNIDDVPVFEIGREIRYHKDFAPGGTNVNFIKLIEGKIYIRTYERGVENETLACGTGSTASAIIGCSLYNLIPPICLVTKGGDELIVNFNMQDQIVQNLSLAGPATMTFTGEFTLN
jgi:diaminopimelate epimerase